MRIAIATEVFLPKIDGITNRLRNTIRSMREQGHEVMLLAPDCPMSDYAGAEVVSIPGLPFPPYPGLRLAVPEPRIVLALRRFQPDVVHVVGPAVLGTWTALAARALALPLVASYHTDLPGYAPKYGLGFIQPAIWPLIRLVHNRADLNLCPSTHTQRELIDHGIRNVGIWRGGVDCERFDPAKRSLQARMELTDGHPERPIVLYAGRLSPEKGLDTLRLVIEEAQGAQLVLVGDGPYRADLERSLADFPVTFTGFQRGEQLATTFASADLFCMPSRTETLGFVVMEAMAAGLPVVAANAGGIPDMVTHGENGLLYDPDSPIDAAKHVRELLAGDTIRAELARRARSYAEGCTWHDETRGLVDAYRRARCSAASTGLAGRLHGALAGRI